MESNLMSEEIIERKKYSIYVTRNEKKTYINFKVVPKSYVRQKVIRLSIILLIYCIVLWHMRLNFKTAPLNTLTFQCLSLFALFWVIRNPCLETISVFKNYGIQMKNDNGILLFPEFLNRKLLGSEEFVPIDEIVDVVINEGFDVGFKVIFYLCIIVRNSDKLKLLFNKNRIRLEDQQLIYNQCRKYMYNNEEEKKLFY